MFIIIMKKKIFYINFIAYFSLFTNIFDPKQPLQQEVLVLLLTSRLFHFRNEILERNLIKCFRKFLNLKILPFFKEFLCGWVYAKDRKKNYSSWSIPKVYDQEVIVEIRIFVVSFNQTSKEFGAEIYSHDRKKAYK